MFSFVILHYQAIDETVDCVNSILANFKQQAVSIIVIDNNSPNGSGKVLLNKYKDIENIYVLLNEENSGFASGNNLGYIYAKNKLNSKFIACINNDTIISDKNFIQSIEDLYAEVGYHIMGPDIITPSNVHQNPYKRNPVSLSEIDNYLSNYNKNLKKVILITELSKYKLLKAAWRIAKKLRGKSKNVPSVTEERLSYEHAVSNIVLHGSALIFSEKYIKEEDFAFYPGTFMYAEEDILAHYCRMKGYLMHYSPKPQIYHKEDAATDMVLTNNVKKIKFIYENHRKSYFVLKSLLENEKN